MKIIKINIPIILLIVFEVAVGILLLVNPEVFTRTVIILFGIVLLLIGITCFIRYLLEKKENIVDPLALLTAVVTLVIGAVCCFCSDAIIGFITAIAIIYGVILVISGIYKLHNYFERKKAGVTMSKVSVASGVIAIVLGILIAVFPQNAVFSIWQVAGILLILEAFIDFLSIVQVIRIERMG